MRIGLDLEGCFELLWQFKIQRPISPLCNRLWRFAWRGQNTIDND